MGLEKGVLAIWHDLEAGRETEVLEWYNREHHIERVSIPGFVRARRYSAPGGSQRLFIYYETLSPAVLGSAAYLERVNNPTDWTRRSMPHFRGNSRTVCRVSLASKGPEGGHAATVRLRPQPGREADLRRHIADRLLPEIKAAALFLKAELWEQVPEITGIRSTERIIRGAEDVTEAWTLVVWTSDDETLGMLAAGALSPARLIEAGAGNDIRIGQYRLDLAVEHADIS